MSINGIDQQIRMQLGQETWIQLCIRWDEKHSDQTINKKHRMYIKQIKDHQGKLMRFIIIIRRKRKMKKRKIPRKT